MRSAKAASNTRIKLDVWSKLIGWSSNSELVHSSIHDFFHALWTGSIHDLLHEQLKKTIFRDTLTPSALHLDQKDWRVYIRFKGTPLNTVLLGDDLFLTDGRSKHVQG